MPSVLPPSPPLMIPSCAPSTRPPLTQAEPAGQLPHLLARAAGPGAPHQVEGVELAGVALDVPHLAEHLLRHLLGHPVPDVDDLVVALAAGDDAGRALLLDLVHLLARLVEDLRLAARHHHVLDAEGDSGAGGGREGDLPHLVYHWPDPPVS